VKECSVVLRDDGVLVMWFTHPTAEAWYTVGQSLYDAGFVVSRVYPLWTEMPTRYKGQVNMIAQEVSLGIVARKYDRELLRGIRKGPKKVEDMVLRESLLTHEEFNKAAQRAVEAVKEMVKGLELTSPDVAATIYGTALALATRYDLPFEFDFKDLYSPAITLTIRYFYGPLIAKVLTETGLATTDEEKARAIVEYITRAMLRDDATRSFVALWMPQRVSLLTGKVIKELRTTPQPVPLAYDFVQTTAKLCGYDIKSLRENGLVVNLAGPGRKPRYVPSTPSLYHDGAIKVTLTKFLTTTPGRAIHMVRQALITGGMPPERAEDIVKDVASRIPGYSEEDAKRDAALALLILSTITDRELAQIVGGQYVDVARELAFRALAHILVGEVEVRLARAPADVEKGYTTTLDEFMGKEGG